MRRVDEQYLRTPFYGSRKMADVLGVNRKRMQRLMRRMGIEAIYPKRRTTWPGVGHKIYPYLLRNVEVTRPNQVWASDITYVPLRHGFLYLVAIMDWYSRYVLSWRLSNTLTGDFCMEALDEALHRARPEIFNSDQGSQFTAIAFTSRLETQGVAVSMDGRGRCIDNVFVERLWRSVKYEEVYLRAYGETGPVRRVCAAIRGGVMGLAGVARAGSRRSVLPAGGEAEILVLFPSARVLPQSPLGHMLEVVARERSGRAPLFLLERGRIETGPLVERCRSVDRVPVCLLGTFTSYVRLFEDLQGRGLRLELPPGSRAMETGGDKGKTGGPSRDELLGMFEERLGLSRERVVGSVASTRSCSPTTSGWS